MHPESRRNKSEMGRMIYIFRMIFARFFLHGLLNRPTLSLSALVLALALSGTAWSAPNDSPIPSPAAGEVTIYGRVLLENAEPLVSSHKI